MGKEYRNLRLQMIQRILREKKVQNQEHLQQLLEERGVHVTQATLSRDLKVLPIGKHPDGEGGYVYSLNESLENGVEGPDEIMRGFQSLSFSGNFGLIKTLPGYAGSIAYRLDSMALEVVLGTIAGDDTILVIPRDGLSKDELLDALADQFPEMRDKLKD